MSTIEWKRRYRNDFLDRIVNDTAYRIKIGAAIIGITLTIWAIIHIVNYRRVEHYQVVHIGWDTQIDVEQYMTVHEGDWYVPSGGRETDNYIKQRGTRQVYVRTDVSYRTEKGSCTTTGTGKNKTTRCAPDRQVRVERKIYRTEPVYDRWYEYDIDRWIGIQPLKAAGTGHEWYMPDTSDGDYKDIPTIGNKRLGLNRTHFFIVFGNDKDQKTADMPVERWKTHNMGERYDITFGWFGNILEINKAGAW